MLLLVVYTRMLAHGLGFRNKYCLAHETRLCIIVPLNVLEPYERKVIVLLPTIDQLTYDTEKCGKLDIFTNPPEGFEKTIPVQYTLPCAAAAGASRCFVDDPNAQSLTIILWTRIRLEMRPLIITHVCERADGIEHHNTMQYGKAPCALLAIIYAQHRSAGDIQRILCLL